jgi:purine-binding chemotaxis protein CheW
MRIKFGLGEPVYDAFTVVIILNIFQRTVGVVVDGVSDVIQLEADELRELPSSAPWWKPPISKDWVPRGSAW